MQWRSADPPRPAAPPPLAPRPYTITAGRTQSELALPLEALLRTTRRIASGAGQPEHDQILALCAEPTSVAEVSARLGVPVGVTRILVSDLSSMDLISVSDPGSDQPTTTLMERVLSGLHNL